MYSYKIWDLLDWFKDYGSRSLTMAWSQWKDWETGSYSVCEAGCLNSPIALESCMVPGELLVFKSPLESQTHWF